MATHTQILSQRLTELNFWVYFPNNTVIYSNTAMIITDTFLEYFRITSTIKIASEHQMWILMLGYSIIGVDTALTYYFTMPLF